MENNKPTESALPRCGGRCIHCPTIILPGIGQSQVFLLDENGNRQKSDGADKGIGFPLQINKGKFIKSLAWPFLSMIFTRRDKNFTDRAAKAAAGCISANAVGLDGKPVHRLQVEKYQKSAARCTQEERNFIYSSIPLKEFAAEAGEDHIYFFAYNSFGNNLETAAELYEMIQFVKRDSGHNKVNIVPMSLGGTIFVSLLHFYPQVNDDLNKILFVVPGLNGTKFFTDLYAGNLNTDEEFYRKKLLSSAKGFKGLLKKTALRLLPKGVIVNLLCKTVDEIRNMILLSSTVMWGLVPYEDYEALAEKLLSGEAHKEIRRQTDLFHLAQTNIKANILKLAGMSVTIFDIVDYNHPLFTFVNASKAYNGDGWINIESASLGATSGLINQPLPAGYVQQNTHCTNPAHNHLSPDGIVDASTGILPDTTFYFRDQNHQLTGENDVIIKLIDKLLLGYELEDVFSAPGRFPQFNNARSTAALRNTLLLKAASINRATLKAADAAELNAAVKECEAMLAETIVDTERSQLAEKRLKDILNKIGPHS